jgi:hypothetical protein
VSPRKVSHQLGWMVYTNALRRVAWEQAQVRSFTDDLAFQLWQLGHPDFQPDADPGR